MHGVGESALLAHFKKKPTRHAATEDGREHGEDIFIFVEVGIRRDAEHELCLVGLLFFYRDTRSILFKGEGGIRRCILGG